MATFSGVVTQVIGNRFRVKVKTAVVYDVETSRARLERKNGTPIAFGDIRVGDKVLVSGEVWPDSSVTAELVRDRSLYTHTGTFRGKISSLGQGGSFTLESSRLGSQTVIVTNQTLYQTNGSAGTTRDVAVGLSAVVKGTWERTPEAVVATLVTLKARLVRIEFEGQLVMKSPEGFTVVSKGILYGVNIESATLKNASGKVVTVEQFPMGGQVRVRGKHISEQAAIIAQEIRALPTLRS